MPNMIDNLPVKSDIVLDTLKCTTGGLNFFPCQPTVLFVFFLNSPKG